jgi:nicotinamidase-related amidase
MHTRPESTALVIIDLQERLLPVIPRIDAILDRTGRLVEAASLLDVPRILTEQYPEGLGRTAPAVASACPAPIEKRSFSCCGAEGFDRAVETAGQIESIVIAGVETHVCVLQTALDLIGRGFTVFVVVDAVGSRFAIDHDTAITRLAASGAVLTTCETVLFEWCRSADHPRFRAIRELVLRAGPERGPPRA